MTFSKASGRLTGNPIVDLYNRIEIECDKADLIVLFYENYETRSSFKDIASIPSYSQALPILESKTKS